MEKLLSETFLSANELTDFVNDSKNKIKREDIFTINSYVDPDAQWVYHLFFYQKVERTAEEIEAQRKILQSIASRLP